MGCTAAVVLPKQGELTENILQNHFHNLPPQTVQYSLHYSADRGGADSDILMKPGSECSEKPVLPGFSEENQV